MSPFASGPPSVVSIRHTYMYWVGGVTFRAEAKVIEILARQKHVWICTFFLVNLMDAEGPTGKSTFATARQPDKDLQQNVIHALKLNGRASSAEGPVLFSILTFLDSLEDEQVLLSFLPHSPARELRNKVQSDAAHPRSRPHHFHVTP